MEKLLGHTVICYQHLKIFNGSIYIIYLLVWQNQFTLCNNGNEYHIFHFSFTYLILHCFRPEKRKASLIADAVPNKCLKSTNIEDIIANNCLPEHNYSSNTNNQERIWWRIYSRASVGCLAVRTIILTSFK